MPEHSLANTALNGHTWTVNSLHAELQDTPERPSMRTVHRAIADLLGSSVVKSPDLVENASEKRLNPLILPALAEWLGSKRKPVEIVQLVFVDDTPTIVLVNSKGRLLWRAVVGREPGDIPGAITAVIRYHG